MMFSETVLLFSSGWSCWAPLELELQVAVKWSIQVRNRSGSSGGIGSVVNYRAASLAPNSSPFITPSKIIAKLWYRKHNANP